LLVGIILGLIGWINEAYLREQAHWYWTMRPYRVANFDHYVLEPEAERALKSGDVFEECAKDCPEMVVVPAGEFIMGSLANKEGRLSNEDGSDGHQRKITIGRPFAVSKFDVTFADWDACVSFGGCSQVGDTGWGRGRQPIVYVGWDDAQA